MVRCADICSGQDKAMGDEVKKLSVDCTLCNRTTNHDVLFTEETGGFSEEAGIHWGDAHHMIRCRGCGTVSFAVVSWDSEDLDNEGQPFVKMALYPSRGVRKPIDDDFHLPFKVRGVYLETLTALSNKAPILAAIGIRAVVEAICADKESDGDNLENKIDDLVAKGYLAAEQANFLHLQRFMGNTAAHEIEAPERRELSAAVDIVENMLKTLYVLPELAKKMRKSQKKLEARNARLGRPATPEEEV